MGGIATTKRLPLLAMYLHIQRVPLYSHMSETPVRIIPREAVEPGLLAVKVAAKIEPIPMNTIDVIVN